MKLFGVLAVLLLLFVLIRGHADLFVSCSEEWLNVKIKRRALTRYLHPQSSELFLGAGCPVTREESEFFEFHYFVYFCGIKIYEHILGILFESAIIFEPENLIVRGYIPISCYVPRKLSVTLMNKMKRCHHCMSREPVTGKNTILTQVQNMSVYPGKTFGDVYGHRISQSSLRNTCSPVGLHTFYPSLLNFGITL